MFATHDLAAGDLNGLNEPALTLSAPRQTSEKDDGLLKMGEILGLKISADWVVLSACNTAAPDGTGEAASGLGRAFLYAGARAVLVSNWPVETTSAAYLTAELFRNQTNNGRRARALSLQDAIVATIGVAGSAVPTMGLPTPTLCFGRHFQLSEMVALKCSSERRRACRNSEPTDTRIRPQEGAGSWRARTAQEISTRPAEISPCKADLLFKPKLR